MASQAKPGTQLPGGQKPNPITVSPKPTGKPNATKATPATVKKVK